MVQTGHGGQGVGQTWGEGQQCLVGVMSRVLGVCGLQETRPAGYPRGYPPPYSPGTSLGSMPGPEQLAWLGLREVTGEPGAGDVSLASTVMTDKSSETVATGQEAQRRAARQSKSGSGKSEPPPEPFFLSEGLPPIPVKLVAKIQSGDFVDMADLLRDNIEAACRQNEEEAPWYMSESMKPRREVPDFLSWVQCFGVFASIVAAKHPERFKALMAYQTLMVREARRYGGLGLLTYDTMFRQQATIPRRWTGRN